MPSRLKKQDRVSAHLHLERQRFAVRVCTGLPCPGGGLAHAGLALLHDDDAAAFFYHPLRPLIPLYSGMPACRRQPTVGSGLFQPLVSPGAAGAFHFRVCGSRRPALSGGAYPMVYEQNNVPMKLLSY